MTKEHIPSLSHCERLEAKYHYILVLLIFGKLGV
jgi:hypothetical protein